ncbi:ABC-type amino acid transport substrate-binding protein [Paraburkholderia sp. JPY465]
MKVVCSQAARTERLTLESGRAVAYMMDDVLLAGTRTLTAKPSDWIITGTPQSSEAYGFMLRRDDPEFRKLVDDTLEQVMKGPEIHTMYDRWFVKPVPPKNISFDFPMSDSLKQLYTQPNDKALE